jgi:hypothetical protein
MTGTPQPPDVPYLIHGSANATQQASLTDLQRLETGQPRAPLLLTSGRRSGRAGCWSAPPGRSYRQGELRRRNKD